MIIVLANYGSSLKVIEKIGSLWTISSRLWTQLPLFHLWLSRPNFCSKLQTCVWHRGLLDSILGWIPSISNSGCPWAPPLPPQTGCPCGFLYPSWRQPLDSFLLWNNELGYRITQPPPCPRLPPRLTLDYIPSHWIFSLIYCYAKHCSHS